MRPQQKRMMVETTRAFVTLQTKQSYGVSLRHISFDLVITTLVYLTVLGELPQNAPIV